MKSSIPGLGHRHGHLELVSAATEGLVRLDAAEVPRRPVGDVSRFAGRSEEGAVPEKYAAVMEHVSEALRLERYSCRTEQTYLN